MLTFVVEGKTVEALEFYAAAKSHVINSGFSYEIEWQNSRSLESLCESQFLKEAGWVVLSSGMRTSTIAALFPRFSEAFLHWSSANEIVKSKDECKRRALAAFGHHGKINAIIFIAEFVQELGFPKFKGELSESPVPFLQQFPFLGPATSLHLAKNLGVNVSKPDRHLVRIATAFGCSCSGDVCDTLSYLTGDKTSVVDVVLWRYATLVADYEKRITTQLVSSGDDCQNWFCKS
jgi:hypothetical protein